MTGPFSKKSLQGLLSDRAETLYEEAPCGFIFTDPDGLFIKVNRRFLQWCGYTEEELLGKKRFSEILSIGSRIYYETNYAPLLRMQGSLKEILLDLSPKGRASLPVLLSSIEVRDEEGKVVLIQTTLFDITDRRQYEKELLLARSHAERSLARAHFLARSGEILRENGDFAENLKMVAQLAIEGFSDGIAIDLTDPRGTFQRVAEAHVHSEKIIPPLSVSHKLISSPCLLEEIGEDTPFPGLFQSLLKELYPQSFIAVPVIKNEISVGVITFYLSELGRRFTSEDLETAMELAFALSANMERAELQAIQKKLTQELQESHEWLETTLQSIGDAVMAINVDLTVSYLNPIAEKLTGINLSEARGRPMSEVFRIFNSRTGKPAWNPVETVLKEKRIVELANNTALLRPDGSKIIIEDSASPIVDRKGLITGVVLVFRDVTKKHEEETRKALTLAELRLEKEVRERFVATLTHDLRSPLTSVRLSLQLLQKKIDPNSIEIVHRALKGITRIDRMIQELLDANRLRAGEKVPMEKEILNLIPLALQTLEELTLIHGERFKLHAPESLNGLCNPEGIRRVLENLCHNAIKYGGKETPVNIFLFEKDNFLHLRVHNSGNIIPKEKLDNLFSPYIRLESEEVKSKEGWGLGLTLVKGVAEAHDGEVRVESSPERGTIFEVTIPVGL